MIRPGDRHEHPAGGPAQHAGGRLVGLARAAAAPEPSRIVTAVTQEQRVADAADRAVDALLDVIARLGTVADRRRGRGATAHSPRARSQQDQQGLAERLLGDRVQRALLIGCLAAVAERQLDGQDADDHVDDAAGDQPGARQPLELVGARATRSPCACASTDRSSGGASCREPSIVSPSSRDADAAAHPARP